MAPRSKVFTCYVKLRESFYVLRKIFAPDPRGLAPWVNQAPPPAGPTSFTHDPRSWGPKRGQSRNLVIFAALAGLLAAPFAASAARLVEDFAPGTAGAWTPYLKSPAVVATADGLAFPAPFSGNADRAA